MCFQVALSIDNLDRVPSFWWSTFSLREGIPKIPRIGSHLSSFSHRLYKEGLLWIGLIFAWLWLFCVDVASSLRLCIPECWEDPAPVRIWPSFHCLTPSVWLEYSNTWVACFSSMGEGGLLHRVGDRLGVWLL